MTTRRIVLTASFLVLTAAWAVPGQAEPFRAGDVLRATFDLSGYVPPPALDVVDVFEFSVGIDRIGPIGSYTTRLFDRGRLLGTYVGADPGPGPHAVFSPFKKATSIYTERNPTVIDFSSFNDGSFDGSVEFTIERGRLPDLFRVSDDLTVGRTVSPSIVFASSIGATSFAISPVPEPASLFLLMAGAAGLTVRRNARRRRVTPATAAAGRG
jgi:hypothetical protein